MSAARTAPDRKRIPFLSTLMEKFFVINMMATPPKEIKRPAMFSVVSFSRKTRYAITGEKTGIVAMITDAMVDEEYFNP
jgi:hypothetical protein